MRNLKNYVIVHYNQSFHAKSDEEKSAQLSSFFSEWKVKDVCFNSKNKPMAFVYFFADGAAKEVYQAYPKVTNSYGFQIELGVEKVIKPIDISPKEMKPRSIIIDGENVARTHGLNLIFSSRGLELAIKYFENIGHIDVKVVVPERRLKPSSSEIPVQNKKLLQDLKNRNLIIETKESIYDDKVLLNLAMKRFAVIVSNDKFRDDQFRTLPDLAQYLREPNILPYFFDDDDFFPIDASLEYAAEYILCRPKHSEASLEAETVAPLKIENGTYAKVIQQDSSEKKKPNLSEPVSVADSKINSESDSSFSQVYVKCMNKDYDETQIKNLFEKCGEVKSVSIFRDSAQNATGCCAINFTDNKSAAKAVSEMNGLRVEQVTLKVEPYKARNTAIKSHAADSSLPKAPASNRLFVGNVDINSCSIDDLKQIFQPFGELEEVKINKEKKFAFVKFKEQASAEKAVQSLNGKPASGVSIQHKLLKVDFLK